MSRFSASSYVNSGEADWRSLAMLIVGGIATAWSVGVASVFAAVGAMWTRLFAGVASFGADVIATVIGIPTQFIAAAWSAPLGFLEALGPLGGIGAVAIVLGTLYIFTLGDDNG